MNATPSKWRPTCCTQLVVQRQRNIRARVYPRSLRQGPAEQTTCEEKRSRGTFTTHVDTHYLSIPSTGGAKDAIYQAHRIAKMLPLPRHEIRKASKRPPATTTLDATIIVKAHVERARGNVNACHTRGMQPLFYLWVKDITRCTEVVSHERWLPSSSTVAATGAPFAQRVVKTVQLPIPVDRLPVRAPRGVVARGCSSARVTETHCAQQRVQ